MTRDDKQKPGSSIEEDILISVLDKDAIPYIIATAIEFWNVTADDAWKEMITQENLGRLYAYRTLESGNNVTVKLKDEKMEDAIKDYRIYVDPTRETFRRLREIGYIT